MIQGTLTNNRTGIFGEATYDLSNWEKILPQNLKGGGLRTLINLLRGCDGTATPLCICLWFLSCCHKKNYKKLLDFLVN